MTYQSRYSRPRVIGYVNPALLQEDGTRLINVCMEGVWCELNIQNEWVSSDLQPGHTLKDWEHYFRKGEVQILPEDIPFEEWTQWAQELTWEGGQGE